MGNESYWLMAYYNDNLHTKFTFLCLTDFNAILGSYTGSYVDYFMTQKQYNGLVFASLHPF